MASKYGDSFFMSEENRKDSYEKLFLELKKYSQLKKLADFQLENLATTLITNVYLYLSNNNFNGEAYLTLMEKVVKNELLAIGFKNISGEFNSKVAASAIRIFFSKMVEDPKYNGFGETQAGKDIICFMKK